MPSVLQGKRLLQNYEISLLDVGIIYSHLLNNFNVDFNGYKHNTNFKFIFYLYSTKAQGNLSIKKIFQALLKFLNL